MEAPIVGGVESGDAAATTVPGNAAELGITEPGLKPGDIVLSIDGEHINTFQDVMIASAMARPGRPLDFVVRRPGVNEPLRFSLTPMKSETTGLLSLGINLAASATLYPNDVDANLTRALRRAGLEGVRPGMIVVSAAARPVESFHDLERAVDESGGRPVHTLWVRDSRRAPAAESRVEAALQVDPELSPLIYRNADGEKVHDVGLIGLTPLVRIDEVPQDSHNRDLLREGDAILNVAGVEGPSLMRLLDVLQQHRREVTRVAVLRDGERIEFDAQVDRKGRLGFIPALALEVARTGGPINRTLASESGADADPRPTPVAALHLMPGTRIVSVAGAPVADWRALREALVAAVDDTPEDGARVQITIEHPLPGGGHETHEIVLSPEDVAGLRSLGWSSSLGPWHFQPVYVTRSAEGNPLRAVAMGFEETWKFILNTYLTIDRLIRGSVGVEQLRGPVGIVHLGVTVADRGLLYLLFLLAMISVNLAVINFLPLPIVDGGLFLFLIYEKVKGRPPSIAFQNAATLAGLILIVTVLIVTLYNDVMRIITG
jgi:regulator of sigma E protease